MQGSLIIRGACSPSRGSSTLSGRDVQRWCKKGKTTRIRLENTCSVTTKSRNVRKFMATINYEGPRKVLICWKSLKRVKAVSLACKKIYENTQGQHNHALSLLRRDSSFRLTILYFRGNMEVKAFQSDFRELLYSLLTTFLPCAQMHS